MRGELSTAASELRMDAPRGRNARRLKSMQDNQLDALAVYDMLVTTYGCLEQNYRYL